MAILEELRAVSTAALHLPGVLSRSGCAAVRHVGEGSDRLPVLLVHGYAGDASVWNALRSVLVDNGFGYVVSLSYNSFGVSLHEVSAQFAATAREAARATGERGVHVVGHSLGGLLARYAIARHGLWGLVRTAVTIATPHAGSRLARFAPGPCARLLEPGTPLLDVDVPASVARRTSWLSYYSDGDRIVPPVSARLTDPVLAGRNVLVPGRRHLNICQDPLLLASIVEQLSRTPGCDAQLRLAPSQAA